jgi:hypothetical protein
MTWVSIFGGEMNLVASMGLSVMIKVFELAYNSLMVMLNEWENHKWNAEYYNFWLWKQFSFYVVNYYSAFFYMALFRPHVGSGCPHGDCVAMLRQQLNSVLLFLVLFQVRDVVGTSLWVKASGWIIYGGEEGDGSVRARVRRLARSTMGLAAQLTVDQLRNRSRRAVSSKVSFVEEQALYVEFRMREEIEHMQKMVISLGYVLFFGSIIPSLVLFFAVYFLLENRSLAVQLLRFCQRPFPRRSLGIGAWNQAVKLLMKVATAMNGFLYVNLDDTFAESSKMARVSCFALFCLLAEALLLLVDVIFPPWDTQTSLLKNRRERVMEVLLHQIYARENGSDPNTSSSSSDQQAGQETLGVPAEPAVEFAEAVQAGDWTAIPRADGSPQLGSADPCVSSPSVTQQIHSWYMRTYRSSRQET